MTSDQLRAALDDGISTLQRLRETCLPAIAAAGELFVRTLLAGGKVLLCGNGGSAGDAAHAAGLLLGTFESRGRRSLPAIALAQEVPALTAIANDFGYEHVFARQIGALARPGDLVVGFSTSGSSRNVVAALQQARTLGLPTVAFTGSRRGPLAELADVAILVPSATAPRIQEAHRVCIHLVCAAIEAAVEPRRA